MLTDVGVKCCDEPTIIGARVFAHATAGICFRHRILQEQTVYGHLTPELSCKGSNKNAREASILNSPFVSFSVR